MTRWPGWAWAWAVTAGLAAAWGLAIAFSPVSCNLHGNCPWTSGLGIFLLGLPVMAIGLLVAVGMSLWALWRRWRR